MIKELIRTVRQALENEGFAYVDYDKGQADEKQPKIKTPAGLVSITSLTNQESYRGLSYALNATLQVRVIDWVSGNSSSAAPRVQSDRWAAWYDRANRCCNVLHSLYCSMLPIKFKSCEFVRRDDNLQEAIIECECVIGYIAPDPRMATIENINVNR